MVQLREDLLQRTSTASVSNCDIREQFMLVDLVEECELLAPGALTCKPTLGYTTLHETPDGRCDVYAGELRVECILQDGVVLRCHEFAVMIERAARLSESERESSTRDVLWRCCARVANRYAPRVNRRHKSQYAMARIDAATSCIHIVIPSLPVLSIHVHLADANAKCQK